MSSVFQPSMVENCNKDRRITIYLLTVLTVVIMENNFTAFWYPKPSILTETFMKNNFTIFWYPTQYTSVHRYQTAWHHIMQFSDLPNRPLFHSTDKNTNI